MLNKEQLTLTMEIVNRAEKLGLMQGDKLTALIDLEKATEHFNLRLADMLNADDFIIEIKNEIPFRFKVIKPTIHRRNVEMCSSRESAEERIKKLQEAKL